MMLEISPRGDERNCKADISRNLSKGEELCDQTMMRDQLSQSSTISNTRALVIRLLATIARLLIAYGYDHPEQELRDVICCVRIVPIKPFEFFSAKGNNCDPIPQSPSQRQNAVGKDISPVVGRYCQSLTYWSVFSSNRRLEIAQTVREVTNTWAIEYMVNFMFKAIAQR
jgi:hypothetical protein